jgi:hypothetical protein
MLWDVLASKADPLAKPLADRHYTRQNPKSRLWTRPGFNFVLYHDDEKGAALWAWWRPKWEAGIERMDKLRAIECTMFRNESAARSSDLIREAVELLSSELAREYLKLEAPQDCMLITGVSSNATIARRSKKNLPGHCYRMAGWIDFPHSIKGKADTWLTLIEH